MVFFFNIFKCLVSGDGIPNHLDDDRDGDGVPNHLEDMDGDGIPDRIG